MGKDGRISFYVSRWCFPKREGDGGGSGGRVEGIGVVEGGRAEERGDGTEEG